jgi:hypothetical protein
MKRLISGIAILFVVSATGAYADSIANFNITQATVFVGPNNGSGDNVFFAMTGPGTNIPGNGGIPCWDWCYSTFSPGDSPSITIGQIFLNSPIGGELTIGGKTYDPWTLGLQGVSVAVLGGFTFPANPNGSTFTACLPAEMPGSIAGYAGEGDSFIQFNLQMPPGGTFCTTWNFDSASGYYQFSQGNFVATAVPEPGTIGFMGTGLVGIVGMIRRKRNCRPAMNPIPDPPPAAGIDTSSRPRK